MSTLERQQKYQKEIEQTELRIIRMEEQLDAEHTRKAMLSGAIQALNEELGEQQQAVEVDET